MFVYHIISIFARILINQHMHKYGLIGYPLKHSFSQRFFFEKFTTEHIDATYLNFEIPSISEITPIIRDNPELLGLNVTIPYKEQVIPYLDKISPDASAIGAINVIKIVREGANTSLIGYNTDVIGFQDSILPLIRKGIHKKALILGTGGASKAVQKGLENLGIESIFVSRSTKPEQLTYQDLTPEIIEEYKIIINSTPLGTFPDIDNAPDIPYGFLSTEHLLYDLVYNPEVTKFLQLGKERGATIKNGYEMLERQAIAAWKIWNK